MKSVGARIRGRPLPKYVYHDFGNFVNLAEYGTVGNLLGVLGGRSVYLEAPLPGSCTARYTECTNKPYTVTRRRCSTIWRRTEPRIKLH